MNLRLIDRRGGKNEGNWFDHSDRPSMLAVLAAGLGRADWTVDLVLVDDEAMSGLNQGFRGAEGVTDVLSFSYLEGAGAGICDLADGDGCAHGDLWLESMAAETESGAGPVVGEVVLAPGFITRQCRENGWPLQQEMPMLVVHGLLHILGWDHTNETETEAMQMVEQEILATAGLPHPMRERG